MVKKVMYHIEKEPQHGKKPNQKLKPYVVLQYLLKRTDENHAIQSALFSLALVCYTISKL